MSVLSKSAAVILIALLSASLYVLVPVLVGADVVTAAVNDSFPGVEGTTLFVAAPGVLGNDVIGTGASLISQVTLVDAPNVPGAFSLGNDGSVSFTPTDSNFNGNVTFTYTVTDDQSFTSPPATVTLSFANVNDAPTAADQAITTGVNTATSSVFSASDIDTGDTLTYATSSNPSHGTVVIDPATGAFTYTPDASYTGSDAFTWQVSDGTASSSDATVSISVLAGPELGLSFIFVNDNGGSATTTELLLDGATTTGATTTVSAGAHTVSSATMSGYDRVIGGDCAADGTITLMNGDSKHCTVTFDDQASGGGTPALGVEDKKPANGPISSIGPSFGTIANFSGMVLGASTSLPELPAGCSPMLSGFFRSTMADTDAGQVKQLQQFLNDTLSTDLPLNGVFGPSTDSAVKKFQLKYAEQILAPWGISQPTGFVYLTTQRWINLMHCSTLDIPMPKLVPYHGQ